MASGDADEKGLNQEGERRVYEGKIAIGGLA